MTNINKETDAQEIETVKNQLRVLGLEFPQKATLKTLREILVKHVNQIEETEAAKSVPVDYTQTSAYLLEKIRCSIVCRNPDKSAWTGEYVTCGNSAIGHHTYFVPYNCDLAEDYMIPRIVAETLKGKNYIDTYDKPNRVGDSLVGFQNGVRYIPEFVITELNADVGSSHAMDLNGLI